jgi:pimeloyl-ACP methyl ester carboxylesterase/anti-sigma regulatory factor (Ser/Thr protein kinase)
MLVEPFGHGGAVLRECPDEDCTCCSGPGCAASCRNILVAQLSRHAALLRDRTEWRDSMTKRFAVISVHGLFSSAQTWSDFQSLVESDADLSDFSFINFEYPTPKIKLNPFRRIPNFDDIARRLATFLQTMATPYEKLAIVTHSQGGLIVQRYLAQMVQNGKGLELPLIRVVVMFACPNSGAEILLTLRRSALFWNQPQERELRPLNELVSETHQVVVNRIVHAKRVSPEQCPITMVAYAGDQDNVVKPGPARGIFPDTGMLPGDHFTIIQPDSHEHIAFKALKNRLTHLRTETHTVGSKELREASDTAQREVSEPSISPAILPVVGNHDTVSGNQHDTTTLNPEHWYRSLVEGHMVAYIDTRSSVAIDTSIMVVDQVLREKQFGNYVTRRARTVLHELLNNVARHANNKQAWVSISVYDKFVRSVSIDVCDAGTRITAADFQKAYINFIREGREHGLPLVRRLATEIHETRPKAAPADMRNFVGCDIVDVEPSSSFLFEYPNTNIAAVRMEYLIPRAFWFGEDVYYRDHIKILWEAANKQWAAVLNAYLGPLAKARYLVVEVTGDHVTTERGPNDWECLRLILETFFTEHFEDKRVLLLAHDTDHIYASDVESWARQIGADYFDSVAACQNRIVELTEKW